MTNPEGTPYVVVLVTVPLGDRGDEISRELISRKLAACVNRIGPVSSVFRWKGAIEEETESLLLIKTERRLLPALESAVMEIHPYENPEFLVLTIESGAPAYLGWLGESLSPGD